MVQAENVVGSVTTQPEMGPPEGGPVSFLRLVVEVEIQPGLGIVSFKVGPHAVPEGPLEVGLELVRQLLQEELRRAVVVSDCLRSRVECGPEDLCDDLDGIGSSYSVCHYGLLSAVLCTAKHPCMPVDAGVKQKGLTGPANCSRMSSEEFKAEAIRQLSLFT